MPAMNDLLRYDPETGKLFWLERGPDLFEDGVWTATHRAAAWNGAWAGKEALTGTHKDGYRQGKINNKTILAHHAIWAIMMGERPPKGKEVDHIDGNRSNNRWANLRLVSHSQNMKNMKMTSRNSSGANGVSRQGNKWIVRIRVAGTPVYLGSFDAFDEAVSVRKTAGMTHGYTDRHGVAPP